MSRNNKRIRAQRLQSNVAIDNNAIRKTNDAYNAYRSFSRSTKTSSLSHAFSIDDIDASIEYATSMQRDIDEYRNYRRNARACENDTCNCACKCHNNASSQCNVIDAFARTHTQSHKTQSRVVRKCHDKFGAHDLHCDCERNRVDVSCHESTFNERSYRLFHLRHA